MQAVDLTETLQRGAPSLDFVSGLLPAVGSCDSETSSLIARLLALCQQEFRVVSAVASAAAAEADGGSAASSRGSNEKVLLDQLFNMLREGFEKHARFTLAEFESLIEEDLQLMQEQLRVKSDVQRTFDATLPLLLAAQAGLETLSMSDICELRAFKHPPAGARITVEALCIMFQIKPAILADPSHPGRNIHDYWTVAHRGLLRNVSQLMRDLVNYDKDNIPDAVIGKLEPFMHREDFEPERVRMCSLACESFCRWVRAMYMYNHAVQGLAPKRKKIAELDARLSACQSSKPWSKAPACPETPEACLWRQHDPLMQKAREMAELKLRCLVTRHVEKQVAADQTRVSDAAIASLRARHVLIEWAGPAEHCDAAGLAAWALQAGSPTAAQEFFYAALWLPSHLDALEIRERFATLALILQKLQPRLYLVFSADERSKHVEFLVGPGTTCASEGEASLPQWDTEMALQSNYAFNYIQFRLDDDSVSAWISEPIPRAKCDMTRRVLSHVCRDVPSTFVSAKLSVRIGSTLDGSAVCNWSPWSRKSVAKAVALPSPVNRGGLVLVRASDETVVLQWDDFALPGRLHIVEYRVSCAHMPMGAEETQWDEAHMEVFVTDLRLKEKAVAEFRVTRLQPGSLYAFRVDARLPYLGSGAWSGPIILQAVQTIARLPPTIPIQLQTLSGVVTEVEADPSDSMASFQGRVSALMKVPVGCIQLCFDGLPLSRNDVLRDYCTDASLSLDLVVLASTDNVCSFLDEAALEEGDFSEAAEVLSFALHADECGRAIADLFKKFSDSERRKHVGLVKDLVRVVLAGESPTFALTSKLAPLCNRSSHKARAVDVLVCVAARGDADVVMSLLPYVFNENAIVRERVMSFCASLENDLGQEVRRRVVDAYRRKLMGRAVREPVLGIDNLPSLLAKGDGDLCNALSEYVQRSHHTDSRCDALQALTGLAGPEQSEQVAAVVRNCLEERDPNLRMTALEAVATLLCNGGDAQSVSTLEASASTADWDWPCVRRLAARARRGRVA